MADKKLILMFGLPGSGKSTKIKQLVEFQPAYAVCSTDFYWIRPDGYYDWNPRRVTEAHDWNFNEVLECMRDVNGPFPLIFVDNTNLKLVNVKRYIDTAKAEGYTVELVEPDTSWRYDPIECSKRNVHRVPLETIQNMAATMMEEKQKILDYILEG